MHQFPEQALEPGSDALRSLDPLRGSLLAMHRVHVSGNVHLKEEPPPALRTLEILPLASPPCATRRTYGDLTLSFDPL